MFKNRFILRIFAISFALILTSTILIYSIGYSQAKSETVENDGSVPLEAPSFTESMGAFPESEAGISAYINTSQTIDIEKIKTAFSVVEEVGDNYIIGIIPISDWGGDIDVHVYADTDGWIVAYLKNSEPASMIMQWGTADVNNPAIGTISTTTLEDAIYDAGDAAGVGIVSSNIKYYDFEFPNANAMMLFIRTKATAGSNIHQVKIPADYMLFEASYYHYIYSDCHCEHHCEYFYYWDTKLKVDDTTVSDSPDLCCSTQWWRAFQSYSSAIQTGKLHTIEITYDSVGNAYDYGSAGVATVLIYRTT